MCQVWSKCIEGCCSQGCYAVKIWPGDIDIWPMTLQNNRVPDFPKDKVCTRFGQNPLKDLDSRVFTRMLCGKNLTRWPWPLTLKINRFQILQRTKYIPSLVKIHWRMLILVFTRMLYGKHLNPWPLTLKINRVPDSPKDYACTKFCQNPLKDVDSRLFTKMLPVKQFTKWPWSLTLKINRVPNSPKD